MRVMIYGSNPEQHSGMGLVAGRVAEGLTEHGWDVHYFGAGVVGKKRRHPPDAPEDEQYWLYGTPNGSEGRELFGHWLNHIEPDLFITNRNWQSLGWMHNPLNSRYKESGQATKVMYYGPPVETERKPPMFEQRILDDHLNDLWLVPYTGLRYEQYTGEWELDEYALPEQSDGHWAPHGTNLDLFHPTIDEELDDPSPRKEYGTEDRFVALFMGENWRRKNIDLLYDAWSRFRDRVLGEGANRPLLIMHSDPTASRGDDKFYAGWNLATAAFGYDLKVGQHLGEVREGDVDTFGTKAYAGDFAPREGVAALMASSDLFVLPTAGEGFSLGSLEAMACGTPIVQTDLPTLRWLCNDDAAKYVDVVQEHALNTGERHATPSVADLADKLYEAWNNPAWREHAGAAGRKRAEEFPWSRMHENLDAAVELIGEMP